MKPPRDESVYGRSALGLWVRARAIVDEVIVEAQERVIIRGGMATGVGADGETRWEHPAVGATAPGTWYEVGRVCFGAPWNVFVVPVLDWPRVIRGVQRHIVALVTAGWGDSVAEVAEWFADPLGVCGCIVPGVYRVEEPYGVLCGFEGLYLRTELLCDGMGSARVLGINLPEMKAPAAEWVLSLIVGAVPVGE